MRFLLCLALLAPLAALAQTYKSDEHTFRIVKVVEGLDHPWSVAFLPDGRMLITERPGHLNLIGGDGKRMRIAGVPEVFAQGQGGLFDVALHPRFAENHFIYLAYAAREASGVATNLARARLGEGKLEDLKVIFREEPRSPRARIQFGGRIVFDRAG